MYQTDTQISGILQTSMILPVLEVEFNASAAQVQWVAASNMLAWVCICDIDTIQSPTDQ